MREGRTTRCEVGMSLEDDNGGRERVDGLACSALSRARGDQEMSMCSRVSLEPYSPTASLFEAHPRSFFVARSANLFGTARQVRPLYLLLSVVDSLSSHSLLWICRTSETSLENSQATLLRSSLVIRVSRVLLSVASLSPNSFFLLTLSPVSLAFQIRRPDGTRTLRTSATSPDSRSEVSFSFLKKNLPLLRASSSTTSLTLSLSFFLVFLRLGSDPLEASSKIGYMRFVSLALPLRTLRSRSERRKTTTRRLDLRSVSSSLVHFSLSQSEER